MLALVISLNMQPARDDRGVVAANDYTVKALDESGLVAHKIISRAKAYEIQQFYSMVVLPNGDSITAIDHLPYFLEESI